MTRCLPRVLVGIILTVVLPVEAPAAERSSFEWKRAIAEEAEAGRMYRIEIPSDIYGRSHDFPNDLRILDARQNHWPFYLQRRPSRPAYRSVSAEESNRAWLVEPERYFRVDLTVPRETGRARPRHNQLVLQASGNDYIRRVEIYGSEQQTDWALLGQGYLIKVRHPRRIEEHTVNYPVSDYPHLQVRVYPSARNALEEFAVTRIDLRMEGDPDLPKRVLPHQWMETPKADRKDDAQVLLLDLGHDHHPVESVRLRTDEGDYLRRAVIHVRNTGEPRWRYAGAGDVHRVGSSVKDRVRVSGTGRFVKCELYHYDDDPLDLTVVEALAVRDYLVVEAKGGADPALFYGGFYVSAPRYDLRARIALELPEPLPLLALSEAEPNPAYRKAGYGRLGPILVIAAVGFTSLAVLLVIIRMLKQTSQIEPGD